MAEILKYADFLDKKTDKADERITELISENEEIVEETIDEICDFILFEMDGEQDISYSELLKDLRESINDWFSIQEKKGK